MAETRVENQALAINLSSPLCIGRNVVSMSIWRKGRSVKWLMNYNKHTTILNDT